MSVRVKDLIWKQIVSHWCIYYYFCYNYYCYYYKSFSHQV